MVAVINKTNEGNVSIVFLNLLFRNASFEAFGSTHTLNPLSTNAGFCDEREVDDWGEDPKEASVGSEKYEKTLACLVSGLSRVI